MRLWDVFCSTIPIYTAATESPSLEKPSRIVECPIPTLCPALSSECHIQGTPPGLGTPNLPASASPPGLTADEPHFAPLWTFSAGVSLWIGRSGARDTIQLLGGFLLTCRFLPGALELILQQVRAAPRRWGCPNLSWSTEAWRIC